MVTYSKADLVLAKNAMLDHLARLSGNVLLPGCCTQNCCESTAQTLYASSEFAKLVAFPKMVSDKASMLDELTRIQSGHLVEGCILQGCNDPDPFTRPQWQINWSSSD